MVSDFLRCILVSQLWFIGFLGFFVSPRSVLGVPFPDTGWFLWRWLHWEPSPLRVSFDFPSAGCPVSIEACSQEDPRHLGAVGYLLSRRVAVGERLLVPCSGLPVWALLATAAGVGLVWPAQGSETGEARRNRRASPVREYSCLVEAWLAAGERFPFNYV